MCAAQFSRAMQCGSPPINRRAFCLCQSLPKATINPLEATFDSYKAIGGQQYFRISVAIVFKAGKTWDISSG
jgi:hypothetical protein